jgi:hypothetical protein
MSQSDKMQRQFTNKYHGDEHTKAENDNRSNQMNPNNDAYWLSRGYVFVDEEEEDN